MTLVACIDEGGGMLFNHRRQSQDRVMRQRIAQMSRGARLLMSPYTARQFGLDLPSNAVICENLLGEALPADFCFVEDTDPAALESLADKIVLYRWNRAYPRDTLFPIDLEQWTQVHSERFQGSSHDDITEEVYIR